MTTSRERVIRSLCHEPVDRAPRDLRVSRQVERSRADDVVEIRQRFPPDIERMELDAEGAADGAAAGLPEPLADATRIASYRPPVELLDPGRLSPLNGACAATSRFVLAWSHTRPLARMLQLLGSPSAGARLAQGSAPIRGLVARLHDFSCREMEMWARSDVDGVALGDAWDPGVVGAGAADLWRELFKPLVRDYCEILRAGDKFVFFHGGEHLDEIVPDLVEVGVDAVGCPLGLSLERLAAALRGKATFWGVLRPQDLRGRPETARQAVTRIRAALDYGRGGIIAECGWEADVTLKTVAAVFDQWAHPLTMHARTAG